MKKGFSSTVTDMLILMGGVVLIIAAFVIISRIVTEGILS
jgi:hypothetical protein